MNITQELDNMRKAMDDLHAAIKKIVPADAVTPAEMNAAIAEAIAGIPQGVSVEASTAPLEVESLKAQLGVAEEAIEALRTSHMTIEVKTHTKLGKYLDVKRGGKTVFYASVIKGALKIDAPGQ